MIRSIEILIIESTFKIPNFVVSDYLIAGAKLVKPGFDSMGLRFQPIVLSIVYKNLHSPEFDRLVGRQNIGNNIDIILLNFLQT